MKKATWFILILVTCLTQGLAQELTPVQFTFFPRNSDDWANNSSVELISMDSQESLGTVKYQPGPLNLSLTPGIYHIQAKNLRFNPGPFSFLMDEAFWESEKLTLEIPQTGKLIQVQIQRENRPFQRALIKFRVANPTEIPPNQPWHGFAGGILSYPFMTPVLDGTLEAGILYISSDPQIFSGFGLRARIMGSPLHGGLWAGLQGHLELGQRIAFGTGFLGTIMAPQIPDGSNYTHWTWTQLIPVFFWEGSIPLEKKPLGWQITLGFWFNPVLLTSPKNAPDSGPDFNPFLPSLRPELGFRYLFP